MLITVEAKGRTDDILQVQIAAQVTAVMKMKSIQKNLEAIAGDVNEFYILPMANSQYSSSSSSNVSVSTIPSSAGSQLSSV